MVANLPYDLTEDKVRSIGQDYLRDHFLTWFTA
jgi:hypothetical protein